MTADPAEKREASMVDGQPGSELHLNTLLDHPTELLDIFFDRMPMGIAVFDRDLLLRRCNPTWADFVAHYTETPFNEVVLGKSFFDLAPGTEEATMPLFERVLAGETVRQEALQLQSGGGPLSYWDVVFTPLVEEGRVVGFIDVVIDATERTLAEKELRESEERFRSLVTNSSDMITIFAPDGTRLYASPSTERILGYAPEDAVGGNYSDVVHPDDLPKIREEFAERARTPGTGRRFEFRARHADGSWRVLESVGTNRVEDSRVGGIVFNARDITERKRTEQALKQERDFSSAVLDTAGSLVVVFDIEGRIVRFNRACERLSGYSFEEVQGRRYWELFLAPEDVEPVKAVMEEVRSRRLPNTNENHWVMRDGSRRLISWSNAILLDEQGEPAYLIGTGIDITEQRQAEDELKESQRALTTLMSNLPGMAYRCRNDEDWTMEFVSEGSLGLTGHAPEDLVGNRRVSYGDLIHPDDHERVWEKVQAGLEERRPFQFNYRMRAASGEMKWVWEQGRGVFSSGGELLALEGFITDVTERVLSRQMLEQRVASLTRIAANLTIEQPMETTLRTLAASVSEASTGEGCSVTLIDEASPALSMAGVHGLSDGFAEALEVSWRAGARSPVLRAFHEREPLLVRNARRLLLDDPLYAPAHPFVRGIPWDTVLIVPLVAGGRTLGAISVYYLPEREPTGEETTFLGAVADQTAVVVENARLFTAAQGKAALEKRQKLARELHDSVSQALYGIALGSKTARTLLDRDPDRVADPLDYVLSLAEAGLAEMRALIFELRPESLENEG